MTKTKNANDEPWRERVRTLVAESGKTRSEICVEAGLNKAYITQILEAKNVTPRVDNLSRLAAVLGTTVSYLVDGITPGHPALPSDDDHTIAGPAGSDREVAALANRLADTMPPSRARWIVRKAAERIHDLTNEPEGTDE